jgi:hypothetical protein
LIYLRVIVKQETKRNWKKRNETQQKRNGTKRNKHKRNKTIFIWLNYKYWLGEKIVLSDLVRLGYLLIIFHEFWIGFILNGNLKLATQLEEYKYFPWVSPVRHQDSLAPHFLSNKRDYLFKIKSTKIKKKHQWSFKCNQNIIYLNIL